MYMNNIKKCEYNPTTNSILVWHADDYVFRIDCTWIEFSLKTTTSVLRNLHRLRAENPLQYVNLYVSGEMQTYCDIEEEIIRGMFGRIVQGYLRQGYSKKEAEIKAKEFFCNNEKDT